MEKLEEVLRKGDFGPSKYIKHEFQDFGYRLAEELDDLEHRSLYIKLAKEVDRELLQKAWDFVRDSRAKSKARLFMWRLAQLKKEEGGTQ